MIVTRDHPEKWISHSSNAGVVKFGAATKSIPLRQKQLHIHQRFHIIVGDRLGDTRKPWCDEA